MVCEADLELPIDLEALDIEVFEILHKPFEFDLQVTFVVARVKLQRVIKVLGVLRQYW